METPKPLGLVDPRGNPIQSTKWIKGPYDYIPFKKLAKKMRKLEVAYEKANSQPVRRVRLMKSYVACERYTKRLAKPAAMEAKKNAPQILAPKPGLQLPANYLK